jgi:hypothetical protein
MLLLHAVTGSLTLTRTLKAAYTYPIYDRCTDF